MSHMVKCIFFDAKNRDVYYVNHEVFKKPGEITCLVPGFKKAVIADIESPDESETGGEETSQTQHLFYYKDGNIQSASDIPNYGFLYRYDALRNHVLNSKVDFETFESFDQFQHSFLPVCGNAMLVSSVFQGSRDTAVPIDTTMSLEKARLLVGEWTDGIQWRLPDFTCILNPSFIEGGYELLLRLENEDILQGQFSEELTKPMRTLSSQMVTFEYDSNEVTIVTGKVLRLDQKVRVMMIETGRSDLRQIAATTMTAENIPQWIQARLRDHFFEKLVANPFNRKSPNRTPERELVTE